jgi:hypothetical protein
MNCIRCNDKGIIEYTGGKHHRYGNSLDWAGELVEATPDDPIYKQCGCRPKPVEKSVSGKVYT